MPVFTGVQNYPQKSGGGNFICVKSGMAVNNTPTKDPRLSVKLD